MHEDAPARPSHPGHSTILLWL